MEQLFANRARQARGSFIREILKVTKQPEVISFAGGLPNPDIFPVTKLAEATAKVFEQDGPAALQYNITEGYQPLRAYIARRYFTRYGLRVEAEDILITNGSQQGLDLIAKLFLEQGDRVLLERPGYLGAIQAFSFYEPHFCSVPLQPDGIALDLLEQALERHAPKLFYMAPNFQNPSGITYSAQKRGHLAALLAKYPVVVIEDDPYGELRYEGEVLPSLRVYGAEGVILLGSFSKIVSPGIRLGWVCAQGEVMKKLVTAKQAVDLHSNYLAQRIIYQYLYDNDLDEHLGKVRQLYQKQRDLMIAMLKAHFPEEVRFIEPEGGMFLWLTLPEGYSTLELFEVAARAKVAFVPGESFFVNGGGQNSLRLNFSNADEARIEVGMQRLAEAMKRWMAAKY
jgi:2-aminoadipate transaminase